MSAPPIHWTLEKSYEKLFTGSWRPYSFSGVILVPLGLLLVLLPFSFGGDDLKNTGALLAGAGAQTFVSAIIARHLPGFLISLLLAFVSFSAGICLTQDVLGTSGNLIPFFAAYFSLTGFITLFLANSHRRRLSGNWQWLMVNAFLSFNLALVSLSRLPEFFSWIFSVFLGLHLVALGSALLAVALTSEENAASPTDVCVSFESRGL